MIETAVMLESPLESMALNLMICGPRQIGFDDITVADYGSIESDHSIIAGLHVIDSSE